MRRARRRRDDGYRGHRPAHRRERQMPLDVCDHNNLRSCAALLDGEVRCSYDALAATARACAKMGERTCNPRQR